jgi:hypothetical protein
MFKAKAELPDDTLEKKLKAAADALRQIECVTKMNGYVYINEVWDSLHEKAQTAWQATQE